MKTIWKILAAMVLIQLCRAGLDYGLTALFDPAHTVMEITETASLLLTGFIFLLVYRPGREKLGLSLKGRPRFEKIIYISGACLVLILTAAGLLLTGGSSASAVFAAVKSVIVIPVFEELLFRGYIWNELKKQGLADLPVFAAVSILFALWHLGYYDTVCLHAMQNAKAPDMGNIMFMKMLTGLGFGLITGIVRWKTKRTYAGVLLHGLLNIFGR